MKRFTFYLLVIAIMTSTITPAFALKKLAQAGMPFLRMNCNTRSAAMGDASICTARDATAIFTNAALLSFVEGFDVQLTQTNWIVDIKHLAAAVAYGHPQWGTFGLSVVKMDYGEQMEIFPYDGADPDLFEQGYMFGDTFEPQEYAIGIGYSRRISEQFSVGGHVRYVVQDLHESRMYHEFQGKDITVQNREEMRSFDFGTMYYTGWKDLRIGMSARNFSNQGRYVIERFELPLNFNIGMAMDLLTLFQGSDQQKLTLAVDWQHPRDYTERVHVGAEYALMGMLYLRGGWKFNYDEEGLTAGIGIAKEFSGFGLKFDYAYGDFGEFFNNIHKMTWGITLK